MFRLFFTFLLLLVGISTVAAEPVRTGTLSGRVVFEGDKPLSGGTVVLYRRGSGPVPAPEKYWLVPDYVEELDEKGRFKVTVEEGSYYLTAVRRENPNEIGPPRVGELFLIARDSGGNPMVFSVKGGDLVDAGTISGARPLKKENTAIGPGITAIEGTLVDEDGKPVEGGIVFAFNSPTMGGRPLFVSERSGPDGKYVLRVAAGGTYYLNVRDVYGGGAPAEGSIFMATPKTVEVATGEVRRNTVLNVNRFHRPRDRRDMR